MLSRRRERCVTVQAILPALPALAAIRGSRRLWIGATPRRQASQYEKSSRTERSNGDQARRALRPPRANGGQAPRLRRQALHVTKVANRQTSTARRLSQSRPAARNQRARVQHFGARDTAESSGFINAWRSRNSGEHTGVSASSKSFAVFSPASRQALGVRQHRCLRLVVGQYFATRSSTSMSACSARNSAKRA